MGMLYKTQSFTMENPEVMPISNPIRYKMGTSIFEELSLHHFLSQTFGLETLPALLDELDAVRLLGP